MIAIEERATELYDVIRSCPLCVLAQTRTFAVPGEGPLNAEVMCIGEAPGVNEDKQGRPFVGAAGQFLGDLLAAAGLTREQVYICNVLKCRPPSNRDPLPNEIEACADYLDLQLDMVDPLVVVTLGRFSMSKWFPQQAISRIHGTVKEVEGRFIVPMYHPAAALHQGGLRQVLLDDFAKLPAIVERARRQRGGQITGQASPASELAPAHADAPRTQAPPPPGNDAEWAEPGFIEDEVEFDLGDAPPPRPTASSLPATSGSRERAPGSEGDPRDQVPTPRPTDSPSPATNGSRERGREARSKDTELPAEEPLPAAKIEQIRLFE